jgi:hypothetical protein
MKHLATYVAADGSGRTKKYPFADGADAPREIRCEATGDVFRLAVVVYDVGETAPGAKAAA